MSLRISDARPQERSKRCRPSPSPFGRGKWPARAASGKGEDRPARPRRAPAKTAVLSTLTALGVTALLTSCGQPKPDDATITRTETAQRAAAGEVLCAQGSAPLAKACTIERSQTPQGLVLTISYPNGGFRRLLVTSDGVTAADGAEPAIVKTTGGGQIDLTIGTDHIQLPATITSS